MSKRRRTSNRAVKKFPKRWGSDQTYVKGETRFASARTLLRVQGGTVVDPETGKYFSPEVFDRKKSVESFGGVNWQEGKDGSVNRQERIPDTKFSISQFNRMPIGEVVRKLADMRVYSPGDIRGTVAENVHVAAKHTDNFAKLIHQPTIAITADEQRSGNGFERLHVKRFVRATLRETPDTIFMYMYGDELYFVRIADKRISLSIRYRNKYHADSAFENDMITWREHITAL